jgi:hypothetical protein
MAQLDKKPEFNISRYNTLYEFAYSAKADCGLNYDSGDATRWARRPWSS